MFKSGCAGIGVVSAEIVNLRRAKKRRARDVEAQLAEHSRARHGRTRAQRDADAVAAQATRRVLDNARMEVLDQS